MVDQHPTGRSTQDSRRIERFKAEAEACAQLDHENIVRAYDFGEASGKLYIVMEFVDGIDLGIAVSRDGVMKPAEAINALTQACAGLAHAHERGIVHRDIKPSNLLLRSDGVVKVSDLGLARIGFHNLKDDRGKRLMGTADYLAPEQAIDSHTVDSRADIYALGCTLFYLLTGSPPYQGATIHKTLAKHQTAAIPSLRDHCPGCPPGLADLARRMMSKRPSDRPRSAVELLSELKRLGGSTAAGASTPLAGHAHADTVVDDSGFGMTLNGSGNSESSGGEIDFGALPAIDLGNLHMSASNTDATIGPLAAPAAKSNPSFSPNQPASSNQSSPRQTLMLGIGLTLASIAMVAVMLLVYHSMTRELPKTQPRIKSVEDGRVARSSWWGNERDVVSPANNGIGRDGSPIDPGIGESEWFSCAVVGRLLPDWPSRRMPDSTQE